MSVQLAIIPLPISVVHCEIECSASSDGAGFGIALMTTMSSIVKKAMEKMADCHKNQRNSVLLLLFGAGFSHGSGFN